MKAAYKEDVEIRWYTDNKFDGTFIDKNRHIFKRKDGTEYITNGGDVTRDPTTGKLFIERRCVTGVSMSANEWVEKVKAEHG